MIALETLKVYQLKDIIRQYAEYHTTFKTKYKSKNKKELIKIIKDHKINKNLYNVPYFNTKLK